MTSRKHNQRRSRALQGVRIEPLEERSYWSVVPLISSPVVYGLANNPVAMPMATPDDPSLPTVSGVSPTIGSTNGGTKVTITGTGFATGATVSFGSVAGSSVVVNSSTSITAVTPDEVAGPVDVVVTTTGGPSATTSADQFTFFPPAVAISPGTDAAPGPVVDSLTPTLTWQAISSPQLTGYSIDLYDTTTGTSVGYTADASASSFTIPSSAPLIAGNKYSWSVRGLDGTLGGPPSYLSFQTAPDATLPAPVSDAPGAAASPGPVLSTTTPTFSWEAITGATFTGYQVSLHNVTANTTTNFNTGTSVTSYAVPSSAPLIAADSYVWTVSALNGQALGPASGPLYFQTPPSVSATLPAPVADGPGSTTSPGPVLTTLTPTFTWEAITTNATFTGYQINLHNVTANTTVSFTTGVSVTSYTPTSPLIAGDAYVWNVRAVNGSVQGMESAYLYFQTPAPVALPAPVAVSPGGATSPGPVISTLNPTLTWNGVSGVTFTGYQINLYNVNTSAGVTYTTGASVTSLTVPTSAPLVGGDTYVWNVRALNGSVSGTESNYLYFQTPAPVALPAPVAVSPGGATSPGPVITTLNPTLTWNGVSGVTFTGYQINLYNVNTSAGVSYTTGVSVTSFTVPSSAPLAGGDTYVWNVRALNGIASGTESNYLYFQTTPASTIPAPVAVSPGTTTAPGPVIDTLAPTLTWNAVTGVTITGYQVNLYNTTANTSATYTTDANTTTFTIPSPLIAGDDYTWSVRAVNGSQTGAPSYLNFQTAPAATLPAPVADSPGTSTSPGPLITSLTPTLTWEAITGVTFTGYEIYLHNVTANTTVSFTTDANTTTYTIPAASPLLAGDTYVWNVRAVNGTASGPPSAYLYFQTPPAATLPAPVADAPGSSTSPGPLITTLNPTFTWEAIPAGVTFTGYQVTLFDRTANSGTSYSVDATATSFTLPSGTPLVAGDSYVWNVRAVNGTASGPPSAYLYFQAPPSTVTLPAPVADSPGTTASPGPVLTTLNPTFVWEAITGVTFTGYQINLHNVTTNTTVSYTTGVSVTSFTLPSSGPLIAGDAYVWNVRALNGSASGAESAYLYFQAPPATTNTLPAPVSVSPGTSTSPGPVLTTFTPTFTWQAITGVTFTGYQITLYSVTSSNGVTFTAGTGDTSFTLPSTVPLTAGQSYVWNVRALNGTQSGPPSVYLYFQAPPATTTTLPAPVSVAPGTSTSPGPVLTTLSPAFSWQAITGVTFTGYQINLYNLTAKTGATYNVGTSVTAFNLPDAAPLIAGDSYVWNVRAVNGTQSGPPSTYLFFQALTPIALPAPVATSPGTAASPGPVAASLNPTFTWNAATGVSFTGYQIYIHDITADTTLGYTTDASTTSFTPTAPLTPGDLFVWNVRAVNGPQSGPPSNYLFFQAPAATPPNPVVGSTASMVQPSPVKTTIPAIISDGATFSGSSSVKIANTTGAKFKGAITTQLYASTDGYIDSSSVLITTMVKKLVIGAGKSVNLAVKFKSLPAGLDGTYTVLARTTDPSGATADSSYGPTIQVGAPFVSLSAAFAPLKATVLKSGATVVLTNYGNTKDLTSLTYTVGFSTDAAGLVPAGTLATGKVHKLLIKPGGSIKLHLRNWKSIASSLTAGSYYLTIVLTDDAGNSTTAVSSTTVTVT